MTMTDQLDTAAIRTGYATLLDALISEDLDDAARTIVTLCDALDAERAENERLRADRDQGAKDYCTLMDRRDALAVHVKKLELALRPFVEYVHDDFRRGKATYELVATDRAGGGLIGAEDLRRARAALAQKGGE